MVRTHGVNDSWQGIANVISFIAATTDFPLFHLLGTYGIGGKITVIGRSG